MAQQPTIDELKKKAVTPAPVVNTPGVATPVKPPVVAVKPPVVNKTPSAIANLITSGRNAAQAVGDAVKSSPLVSNFQTPAIPTGASPALAAKVKSYYDKGLDVDGNALPGMSERAMDAVLQAPQNISAAYTKGYKAIGDSIGGTAGEAIKAVPTVLDIGIPALAGGGILAGAKGAGVVSGLAGLGVKGTARFAGGVAGAEHAASKPSDSGSVGDFLIDAYKNKAASYKAARDTSLGVPGAEPLPQQLHDEGFAKNVAYQAAKSAILLPARATAKVVSLLPENWDVTKQATAIEKGIAAIPDAPNYEGQGHLARLGTAIASAQLYNKGFTGVADRVSQTFSNIGEDIATRKQNLGVIGDRIYSKFMNPNKELPMYKEASSVPVDFTDTGGKAKALKHEAVIEAVQDKAEDKAAIAPVAKDPLKDFEAQASGLTGTSLEDKVLEIKNAQDKKTSLEGEQKGLEAALETNPTDETLIAQKATVDANLEKAAAEIGKIQSEYGNLPVKKENAAFYEKLRISIAKSVPASAFVKSNYAGMQLAEKELSASSAAWEKAQEESVDGEPENEVLKAKYNADLARVEGFKKLASENPEITKYAEDLKTATAKYMAVDAQADAEKAAQELAADPLNALKKSEADRLAVKARAMQDKVSATPVAVAPTTVKPATVAPTTVKPATVAPTTVKPATVAPTTVKPVTTATTVKPTVAAPTTVKPTVAPTTVKPAVVDGDIEEEDAPRFERTPTGFADDEGNFVTGTKEDARKALSKNDAYPTADKDYLDNRLMNGTITDKQYAAALSKGGALKTKGGTFSVMPTTVVGKAPEAPAAAPDPYAAIIQQLTNQMNNTGQDFASRRKAVTAKAALKDVLAQREQSLDRAQRETQAMREAAVRATEFDYRKGRDVTGDARYEAEKARLYGNDDLDRKERAAAVARLEEQKQYERSIHKDETQYIRDTRKDETAYARGQDKQNLARQTKLDDATLLQTKMNVYKDVQAMKNQGIQGNSVAAQAFQDAKARADANPNDVAAKVTMDQLRSGFPDVVKRFDVTIVPDPKAAPAEYERQVAAANEQAVSRNEAKQNATRASTFSALKGSTPEITQARERAFQVEKNRLNLEIEKEMSARRDVTKENLKKANPGVTDAKLEQEAAKQVAAKFGADFAMRKARVNSVALNKAMDKDINTVYTLAGLKTTPVQKTILEAE